MKIFKGAKFKSDDKTFQYRSKRRNLITFLKYNMAQADMYTYVTCFSNISPEFVTIIEDLSERKSHYTSFTNFLSYFEKQIFPDVQSSAQIELHNCKQGQDESITNYY